MGRSGYDPQADGKASRVLVKNHAVWAARPEIRPDKDCLISSIPAQGGSTHVEVAIRPRLYRQYVGSKYSA